MSNVAVKAEVVDAANLLVRLYFCHYYVRVLLISPLLAKELVQVDGLQGAHLGGILNQLVEVALLGHFAFLTLLGEGDAGVMPGNDTLVAFLLVVLRRHLANLIENLCAQPWHLLQVIQAVVHFGLERRVSGQHFFHLRRGHFLP